MSTQNAAGDPPIALNPDLDEVGLRERFDATSRVQIKDALHPDTAERLYSCLTQEMPWLLAYNEDRAPKYLQPAEMASMGPQQLNALMQQIFQNAARGFQFVYLDFPVSGTAHIEGQPRFYTHDVLDFLNGEIFRGLVSRITGVAGDLEVDAHATCYQSGHFLTNHNDVTDPTDTRELAYVINMTKDWRADWGGKTEFFDENENVIESFVPTFNTITMFKVPQPHAVSFVVPFCQSRRVAMTGWLFRPLES